MYDKQLWYWPLHGASIILNLYLDGSFSIENDSEFISNEIMDALLIDISEAIMEVDDFLDVKGLVLIDHLPL